MKYNFKELVDISKLQELTDELYIAASIPSAIVSMDGEVLTGSGWQRICTDFHRQHPESKKDCFKSDIKIRKQLNKGESFAIYKCPRGLVDASSPVIIAGEHVANIFSGQLFLKTPDEATEKFFREQAQKFDFDETEYIRAFKEIPVFTEKKFRSALAFLAKLAQIIAGMGLTQLNELESVEMLRKSEEEYRGIFENAVEGFFQSTPEGRFISINPVFAKILGYESSEELISSNFDIEKQYYVDNEDRQRYKQLLQRKGSVESFECRVKCKDGSHIWVSDSSRAIYDRNGKIIRFEGNVTDITKRKRTEKALQKERYFLKKAQDIGQIGTWELDIPKNKLLWTDENYKIFGIPIGTDLTYEIFLNCVHPDDREYVDTEWKAAFNKKPYNVEHRLLVDGKVKWVRQKAELEFNEKDECVRGTGFTQDITQIKQAEKEKINAQKIAGEQTKLALVGQVAGKMAHDFNNILGIIMGNTELSLMDCKDAETKKTLELIFEQTLRGKNLTRNLVAFAKDQEPKQEFFRLSEKIDLVINLMRKDLEGIELIKEDKPGVPELLADPGMIEHALVNLIQNSVHAVSMVEHPLIIIRIFCMDDNIYFEVKDNGCGISEEYLEAIYEPSFSLKGSKDTADSYKAGIKGTGYGMANVKKYIEMHKGSISVNSKPGSGTIFTISLPVIKEELTREEKIELQEEITHFEKYILLVEDETAISNVQYKILTNKPCNHKVDIANTGQIAMDLFDRTEYDFISLDYILPGGINGMDIYHHIRKTDKNIPILFISGNIEFLESIKELKHKDAGIDHLSKPCRNKDYINGINKLLERVLAAQE